jgi:histidine triad (HIT) family protein
MSCEVCDWIEERDSLKIVYEDERTLAFMSPKPITAGHIVVVPKEHYGIIDEVPDDMVAHFFYVASFAATALFEGLGGGGQVGTNIVVNDGKGSQNPYSHFSIHIILRRENDGIGFKWEPTPADSGKLDSILERLKDQTCYIGHMKTQEKTAVDSDNSASTPKNADDMLLRQLERVP